MLQNKLKHCFLFFTLVLGSLGLQAQNPNPLVIPDTLSGNVINLEIAPSTVQYLSGAATATYGINKPYLAYCFFAMK